MNNREPRKILIWAPGITHAKGGIQTYLRSVCDGLIHLTKHTIIDVHTKLDTRAGRPEEWPARVRWHAYGEEEKFSTARFALGASWTGISSGADLVICGHVNFSPLFRHVMRLSSAPKWLLCYGFECWGVRDPAKQDVMRRVDRTVSISRFTRDTMIADGNAIAASAAILPVSFDESRFEINPAAGEALRGRLGFTAQNKVILTVTRLSADEGYKGYDTMIRLMPEILQSEPRARYVLVGKGSDLPRVEKLVEQLGLRERVHLAGFVPDEQIGAYYNMCDVFCMPSHGEGFGIVFLEAMSCGKPVIGGNADGSRDALCDGELGWMVNPKDDREILSTLLDVLAQRAQHPLAWQPHMLRDEVRARYGRAAFERRLAEILREQGWSLD